MTGNKYLVGKWIKTTIGIIFGLIANEDTGLRSWFKFMCSVGTQPRVEETPINVKVLIITHVTKEFVEWGLIMKRRGGNMIHEICGS